MFPIAKIAAFAARELPRVTPEESGDLSPRASWVKLDGSTAAREMALANASQDGELLIIEATAVDNTVDVDFTNDAGGSVTWTASAVGQKLILLSSANGRWTIIAGSAS